MNRIRATIGLLALLNLLSAALPAGRAWAEDQAVVISQTSPPAETLAQHLAANAISHARGRTGNPDDLRMLAGWSYNEFTAPKLAYLTNSTWTTNFWLAGTRGLAATCIGFSNGMGGQGLVTMVSPRHYLCATHMHPESYLTAFLGANNVIYWRTTLGRADVADDTSVGLLNADLPPVVGFLPVLPVDFSRYLPTNHGSIVQGIGMNQDMRMFSQPMTFEYPGGVSWNSHAVVPSGLGTNWSIEIRGGDSSNPAMLLINNQLVLVSHNAGVGGGPAYAFQFNAINRAMHLLSVSNHLRTDYQLTPTR